MGLLKLAEKYSAALLEEACKKALSYSKTPSYKSIKNLLVTLSSKSKSDSVKESVQEMKANQYGITRGARYYGGNRND